MIKTLIVKQYYECFRSYFVNPKTGKRRSKGGIIGMFIMFASIMLFLSVSFFAMTFSMLPLLDADLNWLYFTVFGIMSISLGVFASVFNTYSSLYLSKDNDLLLSMPISPADILISRISLLYGLAFIYSAVVWLPAIISASIAGKLSILSIIFSFILLFVIALLVSAISCILGFVIALVTSKVKNKSLITVVLSIAFIGLYYAAVMKASNFFESFLLYSDKVANGIKTWASFLYHLGNGAAGDFVSFIIFTLIVLVASGLVLFVLARSYSKILTRSTSGKTISSKVTYNSSNNVLSTLFKKELRRFTSLPIYVLNCSLGSVFVLGLSIYAAIKKADLLTLSNLLQEEIPQIFCFAPIVLICLVCLMLSMNVISTPSISLEGKNLWIYKSLPIKPFDILTAKEYLHILINGTSGIIGVLILGWCLSIKYQLIIYAACVVFFFTEIQALAGLMIGLLRPNFVWTSETQPIKQSINVLVVMLIGVIIVLAIGGICYLTRNSLDVESYLYYVLLVMIIITILLKRWMRYKGTKIFKEL